MTTDTLNLPELPEPAIKSAHGMANAFAYGYHADQMRAYATAAVLAERERCAKVCEKQASRWMPSSMKRILKEECASAIRGSSPASQGEGE